MLALTDEPQSTRAWAQGAQGERELARALAPVAGIRLLNDRHVRGTRGNIDHIAVAPAGVFVIDSKLYSGLIRIRDVGGLFQSEQRLYVGQRDCSRDAASMAWQVQAVGRVIRSLKVAPVPSVTPVLCFVKGEWPWVLPPSIYCGVQLETPRTISKLLLSAEVLDIATIDAVARALAEALPAS